ncbi:MAG: archaellin/type IV pilin N-terminal domain-containing protein, partial [Thermoproteota archaeon]
MRRITKDKSNIYTKLLKDKKGISPVITTVILVAVGIALAVAIGLWMSGLVATFTRFEKLEITSAYAISTNDGWTVYITAKNTGSADA